MRKLLAKIKDLESNPEIKKQIKIKLQDFKKQKDKFSELCFCLLTAGFRADRSIKIQEEIGLGFHTLPERKLAKKLKKLGHRFPNARANYICKARKSRLNQILEKKDSNEVRDLLIKNIKGLGYKEASHFLRNIGYDDFAIIDFHIIDLLVRNEIIDKPKILTPKKYLEIEKVLGNIAKKAGMSLAELDLYLWCMETGKIWK